MNVQESYRETDELFTETFQIRFCYGPQHSFRIRILYIWAYRIQMRYSLLHFRFRILHLRDQIDTKFD
jgi:hypothetical protein